MRNVYILLFSCCLVSADLVTSPYLAYQDSYGQYSFGYSAPGSARSEIRTLNGETRGIYSYVDDAGVIQTTQYIADDKNGFRVAATNLPQAPLPQLIYQQENLPTIVAARINPLQKVVVTKEEGKVGEKNIFLQGPQPLEKKVELGLQLPQNKTSEATKSSSGQIIPESILNSRVPIFRISQDKIVIDPYLIQRPIKIQDSSLTPADTTLQTNQESKKNSEQVNTKESPAPLKEQPKPEGQDKPADLSKEVITPVDIVPLNTPLIKYAHIPTLHYIVYKNA
ncbi:PREDICTED: uncharacterized protein LOC108548266 [Eufriesea mexicana]|uniref:uncharacterized protein LOC108548266 n=1 Tax=Eufriesea mexicana TaxID=516756 RepID=UPI00083C8F3C|nr:PREDICTED: uncharacterized protein LOC108548266 [Eufriesea mexicana]